MKTPHRPLGTKCSSSCRRPTPSQAHCSVCHQTFGGVSGFDKHRRDGFCVITAELTLVDGLWRKIDTRPRPDHWGVKKSPAGVARKAPNSTPLV